MVLFLSGGGDSTFSLDSLFAKEVGERANLLYVPNAMKSYKYSYEDCQVWMENYYSKYKNIRITMQTDLSKLSMSYATKFSGMIIGGGNTFDLANAFQEQRKWGLLKELVSIGFPITGVSAGALLFARTVYPALSADSYNGELDCFSGLNCLDNYDLWCHYTKEKQQLVCDYAKQYKLKNILALSNYSGLVVSEKSIELVGKSSVIFNNNSIREINEGEIIERK